MVRHDVVPALFHEDATRPRPPRAAKSIGSESWIRLDLGRVGHVGSGTVRRAVSGDRLRGPRRTASQRRGRRPHLAPSLRNSGPTACRRPTPARRDQPRDLPASLLGIPVKPARVARVGLASKEPFQLWLLSNLAGRTDAERAARPTEGRSRNETDSQSADRRTVDRWASCGTRFDITPSCRGRDQMEASRRGRADVLEQQDAAKSTIQAIKVANAILKPYEESSARPTTSRPMAEKAEPMDAGSSRTGAGAGDGRGQTRRCELQALMSGKRTQRNAIVTIHSRGPAHRGVRLGRLL